MQQVKWRAGTRFKVPAETVHSELIKIREKESLTPAATVEAARAPDSPLHPLFEWRNDVAAELHREDTARKLIKGLEFVTVEKDRIVQHVAFVHVPRDSRTGAGEYEPTASVVLDRADLGLALRQLQRQLDGIATEIRDIERLAGHAINTPEYAALQDIANYVSAAKLRAKHLITQP